jgi:hypothetical protein
MKEKKLTTQVKYLTGEELLIDGIQLKYQLTTLIPPVIFFILLIVAINIAAFLVFPMIIIATFLVYRSGQKSLNSQFLRFHPKRLYISNEKEKSNIEQMVSTSLKSPLFLDIIVKSKKELLYISFEQYNERIGSAAIHSEDLPLIVDSLEDFYGLEVYDSRSTAKEEVLLLRPKDIDEPLMLSFIRVTEDGLRLIINPTSNRQNFMVNYHRRVIKTAKNKLIPISEISKITFWVKKNIITINITLVDKSVQELIKFKTKAYQQSIINQDIKVLIDFLESKPVFQNTILEISKY